MGIFKFKRSVISILITLCMVVTLIPGSAMAASTKSAASVTVYVTISENGEYVTGNDSEETVMARVPVTVPYFDLKDYGLEEFYRYQAASFEDGGGYIGSDVIEQPTLLHCFIKVLEQYYLGGNEDLIIGSNALNPSGSSTSFYMTQFWGHDENLMYFVDHQYPLMSDKVGSTADYILLEDGMEIDLAMFQDWGFYQDGAFSYFNPSEKNVFTEQEFDLTMLGTTTNEIYSGDVAKVGSPMQGEKVKISSDQGKTWENTGEVTDSKGVVSLTLDEPGTYYVSAGPFYETFKMENGEACVAPPLCTVKVKDQIHVADLQLNKQTLSLQEGEKEKLTAAITPSNADNKNISWFSSDPAVAEVAKDGTVTAKSTGDATITAKTEDGEIERECQVTVTKKIVSKPAIPTKIKAATTYSSAKLTWDKVKGANGYQIRRAATKTGTYSLVKTTTANSYTNTGLATGKTYFYKVGAYKKDGIDKVYGSYSGAVAAKPTLNTPASIKVKPGKSQATISWKKVSGASGYTLYRATKKTGKYTAVKAVKSPRYTNKKLKKKKTYYYKVKAYRTVSGKKVYSGASKAAGVKIK